MNPNEARYVKRAVLAYIVAFGVLSLLIANIYWLGSRLHPSPPADLGIAILIASAASFIWACLYALALRAGISSKRYPILASLSLAFGATMFTAIPLVFLLVMGIVARFDTSLIVCFACSDIGLPVVIYFGLKRRPPGNGKGRIRSGSAQSRWGGENWPNPPM